MKADGRDGHGAGAGARSLGLRDGSGGLRTHPERHGGPVLQARRAAPGGHGHRLRHPWNGQVRRSCAPLPGARVEWWQATLRARTTTPIVARSLAGDGGGYRFETHFPPPYGGRPSHVHFKIAAAGHRSRPSSTRRSDRGELISGKSTARGGGRSPRFLARCGYAILDKNVRTRTGEIDLVAKEGKTLVFVEVKTRKDLIATPPPQAGVNTRKQNRLGKLAQAISSSSASASSPAASTWSR